MSSSEYEVGGDLDHPGANRSDTFGDVLRAQSIDRDRRRLVLFSTINRGIGCGIDHDLGLHPRNRPLHCNGISNIEFRRGEWQDIAGTTSLQE